MAQNNLRSMSLAREDSPFARPTDTSGMNNEGHPTNTLSELDLELVKELEFNARQSIRDLAKKLGASHATVHRRFRRLVKTGMIEFAAVSDSTALGFKISVLVGLDIRSGEAHTVANSLRHYPNVTFISLTTGRYDIMFYAVFRNQHEVLDFLDRKLSHIPGILTAEDMVVLELKKRSWMYLRGETVGYPETTQRSIDQSTLDLIKELELNPRESIANLARKTRMSSISVTRKLQALLDDNILKIVTVIDPFQFGFGVHTMILVRAQLGAINSVADILVTNTRIPKLLITTGPFNIAFWAMFQNLTEMSYFLTMEIGNIPGIIDYETLIQVEHLKRASQLGRL
ncbi:MAG: winged helix-turn-helix transcriptional regulator [Dehalococcoidia bacterium]